MRIWRASEYKRVKEVLKLIALVLLFPSYHDAKMQVKFLRSGEPRRRSANDKRGADCIQRELATHHPAANAVAPPG